MDKESKKTRRENIEEKLSISMPYNRTTIP
jgi:hypothetical protein